MQYYEDKKIISVEDLEGRKKKLTLEVKGEMEGDVEQVEEIVNKWEFEVNSSETPIDASDARNNRAIYIVDAIYDLFKVTDVKVEETSFIFQKLIGKLEGVEQTAINNCFGKESKYDIRISDWEGKL